VIAFGRILGSKPLLWAVLSIPGMLMLRAALQPGVILEDLLHPSGEWSARLLILALMLTPLSKLLPRQGWVQWLVRRRRSFGVAAFAYALLHLVFYLLEMRVLRDMLAEIGAPGIWTGWLAFLLMLPLALTSNDLSMERLKAGWKRLQRLAYPAALLTLAHWALVHDNVAAAFANFAPLALLQAWRLLRSVTGKTRASKHPTNPLETLR
jgi:sulfoxide reductase heme-binding subunit YedZ